VNGREVLVLVDGGRREGQPGMLGEGEGR